MLTTRGPRFDSWDPHGPPRSCPLITHTYVCTHESAYTRTHGHTSVHTYDLNEKQEQPEKQTNVEGYRVSCGGACYIDYA